MPTHLPASDFAFSFLAGDIQRHIGGSGVFECQWELVPDCPLFLWKSPCSRLLEENLPNKLGWVAGCWCGQIRKGNMTNRQIPFPNHLLMVVSSRLKLVLEVSTRTSCELFLRYFALESPNYWWAPNRGFIHPYTLKKFESESKLCIMQTQLHKMYSHQLVYLSRK